MSRWNVIACTSLLWIADRAPGLEETVPPTIRFENSRLVAEVDPRRALLERLELKRPGGAREGDVRLNRERHHPGAGWRLWCEIGGRRHTVLRTFNPAGAAGVHVSKDAVTIESRFGRSIAETVPVHMQVTYVVDERGMWMYGRLATEVPVRIEQLEYIVFLHFQGDPRRTAGTAFVAPGWSDPFERLEPRKKKCPRNSSSKYFYSAPWLDRRAMGWSWKGQGIWAVFPDACATRGRFQKDIGVFYHFDPEGRREYNTHYITLQVEAQHHYGGCHWYTLPVNPYGVHEDSDPTVRPDQWTLEPGEVKYYGPYLVALTDTSGGPGDDDEASYAQACFWGEALRGDWPPSWFPLRPRKIRLRLEAPPLADGTHYCVVLYSKKYWFSAQTVKAAELSVDVFPGEAYRGVLIRTDDRLSAFEVLKTLFDGKAIEPEAGRVHRVVQEP